MGLLTCHLLLSQAHKTQLADFPSSQFALPCGLMVPPFVFIKEP